MAFHLHQPLSTFRNTVFDLLRLSWTFIDIPRSRHQSLAAFPHPGLNLPQIHSIFALLVRRSYPPDFTNFFLDHSWPSMSFLGPFFDVPLPHSAFRFPPFPRYLRCTPFSGRLLKNNSARHWEGALRWTVTGDVAVDEDKHKDGSLRSGDSDENARISHANHLKLFHSNESISLLKLCQSKHRLNYSNNENDMQSLTQTNLMCFSKHYRSKRQSKLSNIMQLMWTDRGGREGYLSMNASDQKVKKRSNAEALY
jgi:hypothetical protein